MHIYIKKPVDMNQLHITAAIKNACVTSIKGKTLPICEDIGFEYRDFQDYIFKSTLEGILKLDPVLLKVSFLNTIVLYHKIYIPKNCRNIY